ncbi:MAG: NAD(P) transhydrogenase subunit beta, partial [Paracoccaceae bacterium]
MDFGFTTAAYVVAAVLFILSLGGLSGQESAKRAVWYGIAGMGLAVFATLIGPGAGLWLLSLLLLAAGGTIGYVVAQRVQMTEMPQLVAAMHSLVGLAAVFVGFIAHFEIGNVHGALAAAGADTNSMGTFAALIAHKSPVEISILRVELFLGVFIGAVTFTGSVIAFGKLAGKVSSVATKLPGGHMLNAAAAAISALCLIWYFNTGGFVPLAVMTLAALFIGYHLIMGIGGADMPVVVSMLNSYSGWAAAAIGFSLGNDLLIVVGALVGSSGAILSYIMCKAMNRSFISGIRGGFG